MSKLYTLGLDVGIASVGWSMLENDPLTEEPVRIVKMGVRSFNPNEVPKTGESTAKNRREKRGLRRRNRRRSLRMSTAKKTLSDTFGIEIESALRELSNEDVYKMRATALDERISDAELCKVILNIFKRRGFRSNRKKIVDKENGQLLSAISQNEKFLEEKGYRTFGEAIYKDERFKTLSAGNTIYSIRNHEGDSKNSISRSVLHNEIELILDVQKNFGNNKITKEFKDKILDLFDRQRNFDDGPGRPSPYSANFEIGNCTFIKGEKRAPKATFTFEYFSALSKINSLRVDDEEISKEQKEILYKLVLTKKEISFKDVRKAIGVAEGSKFNLCNYQLGKKSEGLTEEEIVAQAEKSAFVGMKNSYEIRKILGVDVNEQSVALIDEVATMLTLYKSDERIDEYIANSERLSALDESIIDRIKGLNFRMVGSLSITAMQKIIPYLLEGNRYDEACKKAGFNHSEHSFDKKKYLKGEEVDERLQDITSPVVKRAVNQTIRIINEVVKKYGSPQFVNVELARELSMTSTKRKQVKSKQDANYNDNQNAKEVISKTFNVVAPTSQDLLKYKLYQEQDGKCMYSGDEIDINRLFEPSYVEVDHVLPYSRSMNDSYNNKVLVLARENQNKRNRTPFEYFGNDENRWNSFVARVNLLKNTEKKRNLLKKNFGEAQEKEFISRNLNDTRYLSRLIYELLKDYLQTTPSKKRKKVVRSVNGAVTAYLRKFWGINKIREDGDIHHAIDATIIATVTDGMIQKVTRFNNMKENFIYRKDGTYINKATGEIMTKQEKEDYEKDGINVFSKYLPTPYHDFVNELSIRSRIKYTTDKFSNQDLLALSKMGYGEQDLESVKPVFVSRAKNVKKTGAIHEETFMSAREYSQTKMAIKTVGLESLKLINKPEVIQLKDDKYPNQSIENYYRPQDDRLLYLKLKEHLVENGRYAQGETEIKPKKDGSNGPVVKKVKVYEYKSSCVITSNGIASNDKAYRVDVFKRDGKFYLCPVYMADVYAKKLPDRVVEIKKEWSKIDDSFEFLFSLYQNDLVKVTSKKEISLTKKIKINGTEKEEKISSNEIIGYYRGTGISTASIEVISHDACYVINSLGVKTLLNIEKLNVDIMGNVFKAPKENREL